MALAAQPDLSTRLRASQRGLRSRLERRETLADLVRATQASLDPQTVAQFLTRWAAQWLPVDCWSVVAIEPGRDVTIVASTGLPPGAAPAVQAVGVWVAASNGEFFSADLARDGRVHATHAAAVLAFPLRGRERPVGALVGIDAAPSASEPRFTDGVLESWRALLEPGALAFENTVLLQRAEALSVTDDLTRLYNSRYLNQSLRRETKRAIRSGTSLSLLFIDLDGFKSINDTYGHLHGSRALVEAASVIRTCARETDVVARFGGDEFAVVLPDTGRDGALSVATRVRERIAEHSFLAGDLLDVRLTASVGIATLPDAARSAEELVQAADRAMYKVKMSGKNGIHLAAE
jgi:diguanylate cyclase (GGDEF)-like protein